MNRAQTWAGRLPGLKRSISPSTTRDSSQTPCTLSPPLKPTPIRTPSNSPTQPRRRLPNLGTMAPFPKFSLSKIHEPSQPGSPLSPLPFEPHARKGSSPYTPNTDATPSAENPFFHFGAAPSSPSSRFSQQTSSPRSRFSQRSSTPTTTTRGSADFTSALADSTRSGFFAGAFPSPPISFRHVPTSPTKEEGYFARRSGGDDTAQYDSRRGGLLFDNVSYSIPSAEDTSPSGSFTDLAALSFSPDRPSASRRALPPDAGEESFFSSPYSSGRDRTDARRSALEFSSSSETEGTMDGEEEDDLVSVADSSSGPPAFPPGMTSRFSDWTPTPPPSEPADLSFSSTSSLDLTRNAGGREDEEEVTATSRTASEEALELASARSFLTLGSLGEPFSASNVDILAGTPHPFRLVDGKEKARREAAEKLEAALGVREKGRSMVELGEKGEGKTTGREPTHLSWRRAVARSASPFGSPTWVEKDVGGGLERGREVLGPKVWWSGGERRRKKPEGKGEEGATREEMLATVG
ncbi:hypothetical protein JCM8547_004457 [Rhodosporidiobolus lusitaniae]